eukprot:1917436-Prymnesium_polylepis.1
MAGGRPRLRAGHAGVVDGVRPGQVRHHALLRLDVHPPGAPPHPRPRDRPGRRAARDAEVLDPDLRRDGL